MKKKLLALVLTLVCMVMCAAPAFADIGPKPSVQLKLQGLEGQRYYVTLIAPYRQYGPWNTEYDHGLEDANRPGWEAFRAYRDADDYHFLGKWKDCSADHSFAWTYYPPDPFKILIWLQDSDTYISSESMERYAFDSYYTVAVDAAAGTLKTKQSYDYTWELISLACRVVLTVLVELALAWAIGWRSPADRKVLLYTNIVTQLGLNIALNLINYYSGLLAFLLFFFVLELLVFVAEGVVYRFQLSLSPKTGRRRHVWLYALAANGLSFGVGYALARWIPGIF